MKKAVRYALLALPLAVTLMAAPTIGDAKPIKRQDGPTQFLRALPHAIARAAQSTFGEEPRKRSERRHTRKARGRAAAPAALAGAPPAGPEIAKVSELPAGANAPIPSPSPRSDKDAEPPAQPVETAAVIAPDSVPIPIPSPIAPESAPDIAPEPAPSIAPEQASPVVPQSVAIPAPRPAVPSPRAEAPEQEEHGKYEADPRSQTVALTPMPAEETACRAQLRSLGVEFEDRPAESSPDGCSMPYPVSVRSLGKGIALQPAALMDCAMAQTMTTFTSSVIDPALKAEYGRDLKSIGQASAYVCRPRNGTIKLSEHAFGNALDIARFTLDDGTNVDVSPDPGEKAAKVLAAVRSAACGPFKTVLGPGSDADHALHLHFDLAPRRNGGTYCH